MSDVIDDVVIRAEGLGKKHLIGHATEDARHTTFRDAPSDFWRKVAQQATKARSEFLAAAAPECSA